MDFSSSKYRDQGVHVDSQTVFSDRQQLGVGEEERLGQDVEHANDSSRAIRRNPISQAQKVMSPYGDYDMDDSSFFAHTTRLNIKGPNPNFTQFLRRRSSSKERFLANSTDERLETASSKADFELSPSRIVPLAPERIPSESYLQQSLQPSLPLTDPTTSRKLLVLDLNGTLLLRSAHSGRRGPPLPYSRIHQSSGDSHPSSPSPRTTSRPLPALRTVYPRPYLSSFCAYIFHPTTLQWLDTMVWSSAQPHSVNDMVDKCFGKYKGGLKAIWARDTLGLSNEQYYGKTQTTKDLAKPWAQIPSLISNHSLPENLNFEVDAADKDNHPSVPQQQQQQKQHSALTTILMDDSASKAALQPWNHLCISEYKSERRKLDVEIAERELERSWLAERGLERTWQAERELERTWLAERELGRTSPAEQEMESNRPLVREPVWTPEDKLERIWLVEGEMERRWQAERKHAKENVGEGQDRTARDTDVDMAAVKSSEVAATDGVEDKDAERKRKRKEKKLLKREELLLAKEQRLKGVEEEESYDELLLAVIGVLDELKLEGNVAGWMRSGGLIHVVDGDDQETIVETTQETEETPLTTTTIPMSTLSSILDEALTPRSKRDSSTISILGGPSKRRRLGHPQDMELDSDSEVAVLPTTPTMTTNNKRRSLSMSSVPSSSLLHPSPPLSSSPSPSRLLNLSQVEQALTGVPLSTNVDSEAASSTTRTKTSGNDMSSVSTPAPISESQPLLWYETPRVLSFWAQRGRKALAELGINIIHGVVPPNQNGNDLGNTGGG